MSHEASSWALRQTAGGQGPKFLLTVLGNHSDKAGVCYPGRVLLSEELECRPETITAHMAKLEAAGLICRFERRRRNGSRTSDWVVLAPGMERGEMVVPSRDDYPSQIVDAIRLTRSRPTGAKNAGEETAPGQVRKTGGPESSEEPPDGVSAPERAKKLRIAGKPVNAEVWQRATAALAEFNRQAGKNLGALDSRDQPSESAKRIYGRLDANRELDAAAIADVIRRTLMSKWWGEDAPSVGVVFGPAVFEDNLSRQPAKRSKEAAWAEFVADCAGPTDPSEDADVVDAEVVEDDGP